MMIQTLQQASAHGEAMANLGHLKTWAAGTVSQQFGNLWQTLQHVGNDNQYLAIYAPANPSRPPKDDNYATIGGLNHLAFVVEDIEATETAVKEAGFMPEKHADYEPGKRFYFEDHDGIEIEVVQYD